MVLRVTDSEIRSDETDHFASRKDWLRGQWTVSWLPSRVFTKAEAQTAMGLADAVARHAVKDSAERRQCALWARELGITLHDAGELIDKAIESPWQRLTRPREPEPIPWTRGPQLEHDLDMEIGG